MKTKKVIVLDYDINWEKNFIAIRDELAAALGDVAIAIEHIGSTSVVGLSAKPVIDIDVVINNSSELREAIIRLENIGYIFEGDLGIADRYAFKYSGKQHLQQHHLYVCPKDSKELYRHIIFRDYLRKNPEAVSEYSKIKKEAAKLFLNDINGYIKYKSTFIVGLYKKYGLE